MSTTTKISSRRKDGKFSNFFCKKNKINDYRKIIKESFQLSKLPIYSSKIKEQNPTFCFVFSQNQFFFLVFALNNFVVQVAKINWFLIISKYY